MMGIAVLAFPLLLTLPRLAIASDAPTRSTAGSLGIVVAIVLGVAAAYLLAHFVVDWLQRRFLFRTGAEYLLLGVLLGPAVPAVAVIDDSTTLAPIIALAAGWVGLLYGMELDLRQMLEDRHGSTRLALVQSVGTGVLVAVVFHAVFAAGWVPGIEGHDAWLPAGVLGCAAAAGSSSAIDLLKQRYDTEGELLSTLRRAARLSDLFAIAAFGLLFCVFHDAPTQAPLSLRPSDWALITAGIGIALGVLFVVFVGDDDSENGRFLALAGIIAFASGAAFFLDLSLLTINMVLGAIVANAQQDGPAVRRTLDRTLQPMNLILLVFAGALWRAPIPDDPAALWPTTAVVVAVCTGFVLLRVVGKALSCWLASLGTDLRGDVARGLLAQGDVALAMAISFQLVFDGFGVDVAYTALLFSVVLHELVAPRILKSLLVDAGALRREAPPRAEAA